MLYVPVRYAAFLADDERAAPTQPPAHPTVTVD